MMYPCRHPTENSIQFGIARQPEICGVPLRRRFRGRLPRRVLAFRLRAREQKVERFLTPHRLAEQCATLLAAVVLSHAIALAPGAASDDVRDPRGKLVVAHLDLLLLGDGVDDERAQRALMRARANSPC